MNETNNTKIDLRLLSKRKKWSSPERTAYHEAGHIVMSWRLGLPFEEATIIPNYEESSAGEVKKEEFNRRVRAMHPDAVQTYETIDLIEKSILMLLAGNAAVRILTGRADHQGAASDRHYVVSHLAYFVSSKREINAGYRWLNIKCEAMIYADWYLVEEAANALLSHKRLTGKELISVLQLAKEAWDSAD